MLFIRVFILTAVFSLSNCVMAADKLEMICKASSGNYQVSYDRVTERLAVTGSRLPANIKIGKVQNDEDGTLIWALVQSINGVFNRDVLISIRKEKWIKVFYGNGSVETDVCH
jgi:hypothetical protein